MKNNYFLSIALLTIPLLSFSQQTENFENWEANSQYSTGSFEGNNHITWNFDRCKNSTDYLIEGEKSIFFDKRSASKEVYPMVYAENITGGISEISIDYKVGNSATNNRKFSVNINNGVYIKDSGKFTNTTTQTITFDEINIEGDISIKISNEMGSNLVIDNITWTGYSTQNNMAISSTKVQKAIVYYSYGNLIIDNITTNSVNVINTNGNVIYSSNTSANSYQCSLQKGNVYVAVLKTNNGIVTKKFICK